MVEWGVDVGSRTSFGEPETGCCRWQKLAIMLQYQTGLQRLRVVPVWSRVANSEMFAYLLLVFLANSFPLFWNRN